MAIPKIPQAGLGREEIHLVYDDARKRFKKEVKFKKDMTQTDKLKEIQRLHKEGYIYTTNSRGRKKQDE